MRLIKTPLLAIVLFSIVIFSCNHSNTSDTVNSDAKTKHQNLIHGLETTMHSSASMNVAVGQIATQEYLKFVKAYPDDSVSADYLFKAGEIATAIQDYSTALQAYEQITAAYPKFRYVRESLYLQGFLLDNYLNDDAKAKTIYEKFLSTYSEGPYVQDAKAAIANLGKSDEELIEQFKKINKEK